MSTMARDRDVEEFTAAVMGLVDVIVRGQAKAFNTDLVAVMRLLVGGNRCSPSEIATALGVPRSSITDRIKQLEGDGKIHIDPDPSDRRSYRVGLTAAGTAEMDALNEKGRSLFAAWVSSWTNDEIRTFSALARRLTGAPQPSPEPQRREAWWKTSTP
jgi:DNA-binding MarR family transcriptional regulator